MFQGVRMKREREIERETGREWEGGGVREIESG